MSLSQSFSGILCICGTSPDEDSRRMKPLFPRCLIRKSDHIFQLSLVFGHDTLVEVVPDDVDGGHGIYVGEREFAESGGL